METNLLTGTSRHSGLWFGKGQSEWVVWHLGLLPVSVGLSHLHFGEKVMGVDSMDSMKTGASISVKFVKMSANS